MANTIRIPRSVSTNTPASLEQGELAYSEDGSPNGEGELFIGTAGPAVTKIATTLLTGTDGVSAQPNASAQDNQTITTGVGIDGADAGDATSITLTLALDELSVGVPVAGDWLAFDNAGVSEKALISAIPLSLFSDDLGHIENIATALSIGTITATTYGITSDGGTDDIVLPEANTTQAGLLGADKWDEIVANTLKLTNVATALSNGTITGVSYGITSDGGADDVILAQATTTLAGVLSAAKWNEIVANNAKLTNVPTALSEGTRTASLYGITSDGGADDINLPVFNSTQAGLAGSSGGGTANYLRADGTWATPPGGVGAVTYQGAFDPTASAGDGSPDLDTISSTIGDMYTVTVAGTYNWTTGSAVLEIGDVLIAESTGTLNDVADWTIVQNNIGAASESIAGYIAIATQAEMDTATDDLKSVTALKYANSTIDGGTF